MCHLKGEKNGKTKLEAGQYAQSCPGGHGELRGQGGKAEYHHDRVGGNPPMVSISVRPTRYSYDMIRETGEFVINLVTEPLTRACDYCGVVSGRDVDKFAKTGLTPVPVEGVSVPGIAESPVSIACRVVEERALGSHTMFLAEVVGVTADDRYLDETGRFDINGTGLIMYSHGEYFGLGRKLGKFGYSVQKKPKRRKK